MTAPTKNHKTLTIGEVAAHSGVAASALRYYERERLLPRAGRRGGKRVWGEEVIDRLALIGLAKTAGFTVAEIRSLLSTVASETSPGPRWRKLAGRKLAELDETIARIELMKRVLGTVSSCDCSTLAECGGAIRRRFPNGKTA